MPFIASLKEKRDCWHMVVQEMWAGKTIAEELRDAALIQQAAQNVLLVDAVLRRQVSGARRGRIGDV